MPCSGINAEWSRGRELRKAQLVTSIIENILLKFRKWFKYGLKAQFQKQHALKGQKLLAQGFYGHKQHALKGQKLLAQGFYGHKQHALKGQKLLAQGSALGIMAIRKSPCKGKSFENCLSFKAFALTGRQVCERNNPGRCPGLRASALSGRVG